MPGIAPKVIQETLDALAGHEAEMAEFFYGRITVLADLRQMPEMKSMFPLIMSGQRDAFLDGLVRICTLAIAGDEQGLGAFAESLGHNHRMIADLRDEHFPPVGEALIAALYEYAWKDWPEPVIREAIAIFGGAYEQVAGIMIKALEADGFPRWWGASVRSSRMLARDVLSVTVELSQPMTWLPGQSVKAEIVRPAGSAPSVRRWITPVNDQGNGTLMEFHVRVIPWGLFSPALSEVAVPGTELHLSYPAGTLFMEEVPQGPSVFIAGSTGLSVFRPMISWMARQQNQPPVELHHGARTRDGLYASGELNKMAAAYQWLTVRYALEDAPDGWPGFSGTVVDSAFSNCRGDEEIFACGPPAMVAAVLGRARESGFRRDQVHYEAYGLLPGGEQWLRSPISFASIESVPTTSGTTGSAGGAATPTTRRAWTPSGHGSPGSLKT